MCRALSVRHMGLDCTADACAISPREVLAATGWASMTRASRSQAGGVIWPPETQIDALFVNFHKAEREFRPTTVYRDFPISRDLFHRESQKLHCTRFPPLPMLPGPS